MRDILIDILLALAPLLISALTLLKVKADKAIKEHIHILKDQAKNEKIQLAFSKLNEAVFAGVRHTSQTFVDAAKEKNADGKLTKEEIIESGKLTLAAAKDYLGETWREFIKETLDFGVEGLNQVLTTRIEPAVHALKEKPTKEVLASVGTGDAFSRPFPVSSPA